MDWLKRLLQTLPAPSIPAQAKTPVTLGGLRITGKVFSLAMQPEAGGYVGPFLGQWGLALGDARQGDWPRSWFDGNYEAILASPAFAAADVHEGAPFWFPEFYKYLHHRVPGSRFVLMIADPDAWFRALVALSGGFAQGEADIHAKAFRREDELRWLHQHIPDFAGTGRLVLHDSAAHYKAAYARHVGGVQEFFQGRRAESLFVGRLDDAASLGKLAEWLRLPGGAGAGAGASAAGMGAGELSRDALLKPVQRGGATAPR